MILANHEIKYARTNRNSSFLGVVVAENRWVFYDKKLYGKRCAHKNLLVEPTGVLDEDAIYGF